MSDILISSRHYKDGFEKMITDRNFIAYEEINAIQK